MAEQSFVSSMDDSPNLHISKTVNPVETGHVNSLSDIIIPQPTMTTLSRTPSTTSLVFYCAETNYVTQPTTNTTQSSRMDRSRTNFEDHGLVDAVRELAKMNVHNSDHDFFDDEDETIMGGSVCSRESIVTSNCTSMSCPICLESTTLRSSTCCTFQCCNSCWRAHISATINDGRIKIPCISNDCSKYLTRELIVNLIRYDAILHERYLKFYTIANQNPRAKTCPRCSHLYTLEQINFDENNKKSAVKNLNKKIPKQVQCSECSLVWCFRCSAPWHENITCKQFTKGDKLLLKWMKQKNEDQWNARKCPSCSSFIQRAGGCPHMTCSSCACNFCYLCGRRYFKIPFIGQHSNKFSVFGCPYNLHPEKPWLRRTIRGGIATGLVVASPIIVVGAATAAVTVLPPFGVYKLVKYVRARRRAAQLQDNYITSIIGGDQDFIGQEDVDLIDIMTQDMDHLESEHSSEEYQDESNDIENNRDVFPFATMDVENLFVEYEKSSLDAQTSVTPLAIHTRKTFCYDMI